MIDVQVAKFSSFRGTSSFSRILGAFFLAGLLSDSFSARAASPLAPVKTDHPRATMQTFISAMNQYKALAPTDADKAESQLDRAVRTLNLELIPPVLRREQGQEAAQLLKEVIDRVIVIDFEKIPDDSGGESPARWRLKDTEIFINKVQSGERVGEYLFSAETVARAKEFYGKVKALPYLEGSGQGAGYKPYWLERYLPDNLRKKVMGVYAWQWLGLLLTIVIGLFGRVFTIKVVDLSKRFASFTESQIDNRMIEISEKPLGLMSATAIWFLGVKFLRMDGMVLNYLTVTIQIVFSFAMVWLAYRLSTLAGDLVGAWAMKTEFPLDDQLLPMLNRALGLFTVIFGTLIAIQNLGVNVMSLLAGLGLGGLAFALAFRDTAANLFGSIMILWDQPFRVGDWIKASTIEGTVEEIGFRSTRVRTFYNSLVTVPNATLANANIDNMGLREYRRIYTTLGVTYDTPAAKMEAFVEGVKEAIRTNPHTRKDYFHVVFSGYGSSSLEVMVYFFLKVPDWTVELAERQKIYLEILQMAERIGVEFAFPTQTLHIDSMPKGGMALSPAQS